METDDSQSYDQKTTMITLYARMLPVMDLQNTMSKDVVF